MVAHCASAATPDDGGKLHRGPGSASGHRRLHVLVDLFGAATSRSPAPWQRLDSFNGESSTKWSPIRREIDARLRPRVRNSSDTETIVQRT